MQVSVNVIYLWNFLSCFRPIIMASNEIRRKFLNNFTNLLLSLLDPLIYRNYILLKKSLSLNVIWNFKVLFCLKRWIQIYSGLNFVHAAFCLFLCVCSDLLLLFLLLLLVVAVLVAARWAEPPCRSFRQVFYSFRVSTLRLGCSETKTKNLEISQPKQRKQNLSAPLQI